MLLFRLFMCLNSAMYNTILYNVYLYIKYIVLFFFSTNKWHQEAFGALGNKENLK